MRRSLIGGIAAMALAMLPGLVAPAFAQTAPEEITTGALYAATGSFASISTPLRAGLRTWINEPNRPSGAYANTFHRKIPLRLVAYDDRSNTATVTTLTSQIITENKVNVLVADAGSALASVAIPIAREQRMLLIDPSGTGAPLFSETNRYIALVAQPASTIMPRDLAEFLAHEAAAGKIHRLAILYATNDCTGTGATALRSFLISLKAPLKIVCDKSVPTSTSNDTVLINTLVARHPDFVAELGFAGNDIAFLRGLQNSAVVLLGANGAGKTTLLKVLLGLMPAWRGTERGDVLTGESA